jgi:hypothetical protein
MPERWRNGNLIAAFAAFTIALLAGGSTFAAVPSWDDVYCTEQFAGEFVSVNAVKVYGTTTKYALIAGRKSGDTTFEVYRSQFDGSFWSTPTKMSSLSADFDEFDLSVVDGEIYVASSEAGGVTVCDWDGTVATGCSTQPGTSETYPETLNPNGSHMYYSGGVGGNVHRYDMSGASWTVEPAGNLGSDNDTHGIFVGGDFAVVSMECQTGTPYECGDGVEELYMFEGTSPDWTWVPDHMVSWIHPSGSTTSPFVDTEGNLWITSGEVGAMQAFSCPPSCGDEYCAGAADCDYDCTSCPDVPTCGDGICCGGEACEDCPEDCTLENLNITNLSTGCAIEYCGMDPMTDPGAVVKNLPGETCSFNLDILHAGTPQAEIIMRDECDTDGICSQTIFGCVAGECALVYGNAEIDDHGQGITAIPDGEDVDTGIVGTHYSVRRYFDSSGDDMFQVEVTEGEMWYRFNDFIPVYEVHVGPTCTGCQPEFTVNLTDRTVVTDCIPRACGPTECDRHDDGCGGELVCSGDGGNPADYCTDAVTLRQFQPECMCMSGMSCSYSYTDTVCEYGCDATSVACNTTCPLNVCGDGVCCGGETCDACPSDCSIENPNIVSARGCALEYCGPDPMVDPLTIRNIPGRECNIRMDIRHDGITPSAHIRMSDDAGTPSTLVCIGGACVITLGYVVVEDNGQGIVITPAGVEGGVTGTYYAVRRWLEGGHNLFWAMNVEDVLWYTFHFDTDYTVYLGPVTETCPECQLEVTVDLTTGEVIVETPTSDGGVTTDDGGTTTATPDDGGTTTEDSGTTTTSDAGIDAEIPENVPAVITSDADDTHTGGCGGCAVGKNNGGSASILLFILVVLLARTRRVNRVPVTKTR